MKVTGNPGGVPVVLLHGFPQTTAAWDRVVPALVEAGYRVAVPAQRGYSAATRPGGARAYRTDELVTDVAGVLDRLGGGPAHLVGHDWGGAVAWAVASGRPELLRSLTVVSTPHPRALVHAMKTSRQGLRSWYVLFFQLPWLPEALLLAQGGKRLRGTLRRGGLDRETARAYADAMREPGALTAALNWYRAMRLGSTAGARRIPVPTLYVWGADDFALGRQAAEDTARYVTGPYEFVPLAGVGHWIPENDADKLLPPLLAHLRVR